MWYRITNVMYQQAKMHCQPKCKNRSTLQSFDIPLSADAPKCWVKTHGKGQGEEKKKIQKHKHTIFLTYLYITASTLYRADHTF